MIFHHKKYDCDYRNVDLITDNNIIEYVTQFKLLEVRLDSNLTFIIYCIKW